MAYFRRRNPRTRMFGCLIGVIAAVAMTVVIVAVIAILVIVGASDGGLSEDTSGDSASSGAPASSGHWSTAD